MSSQDKRARPLGARLVTILCVLAAPVALYFAARNALVQMNPELGTSLPPVNYAMLLRRAAPNAAHPEYKVDQATLELAQQAAHSEPLDWRPFFITARAVEQRGRARDTVPLLEEARRRRATWLPIRLLLAGAYFEAGDRQAMTRELDYALRLNERVRIAVLPEFVKLLRDPQGRGYIDEMLATNPSWKGDFFAFAGGARVAPEAAADLLRRASARGGDVSLERQLYLRSLIAAGRPDEARRQWLASLPPEQRGESRFLFNGNFRAGNVGGDFGWNLATLDIGRSDIVSEGGTPRLQVRYFGGSNAILARQLITLAPGRYRLQIAGQGDIKPSTEQMRWEIVCQPGGANLLTLPVNRMAQGGAMRGDFSVPAQGCRGQLLRLSAQPGDVSSPAEVEFTRIEIGNVG